MTRYHTDAARDARLRSAEPARDFDVCGPQPDPERPPVIVIQELDHAHEEAQSLTATEVLERQGVTGKDVFDQVETGPWARTPIFTSRAEHNAYYGAHAQLQHEEHERVRKLAEIALARMEAHLPPGAAERKGMPVATGFIDYFPDAVACVATLSRIGNDQHNPGKPLHWDRSKSGDESDALMRHFLDRGTFDSDGVRHSAKVAWRAMAMLQKELEAAKGRLEPIFREPAA